VAQLGLCRLAFYLILARVVLVVFVFLAADFFVGQKLFAFFFFIKVLDEEYYKRLAPA